MISVSEILEGFSGDGWREEGGREGGVGGILHRVACCGELTERDLKRAWLN